MSSVGFLNDSRHICCLLLLFFAGVCDMVLGFRSGNNDFIVDFIRSKTGSPCQRRYVVERMIASTVPRCSWNIFRIGRLEDMEDFFQGLVSQQRKHSVLTLPLGDDFHNFSIIAKINYMRNEERYLLSFDPRIRPHSPTVLCITDICPPTTLHPPTLPTTLPLDPNPAAGKSSLTSTAPTYRLLDPRFRWFTTAMFLAILSAIFLFLVIVLSILLHKSRSRKGLYSNRPAVIVTSSSHLDRRKGSTTSSVVHVPRVQTDSATGYYGDIERRKLRSQELRRSSSEANSISGTLPRLNGSVTGGPLVHKTGFHHTLPCRPQYQPRHQYFNNNNNGGGSIPQQHLQVYHSPPRQPRDKLIYHPNGNGIAGKKANSLPPGIVHGGGVAVDDLRRSDNTNVVNGLGKNSTPSNTAAWSESQASHTPLSNLSNLSEEEGELL